MKRHGIQKLEYLPLAARNHEYPLEKTVVKKKKTKGAARLICDRHERTKSSTVETPKRPGTEDKQAFADAKLVCLLHMLLEWCILIHPPCELLSLVASHKNSSRDSQSTQAYFQCKEKTTRILNVSIRDLPAETLRCPHQKTAVVV